MSQSPVTSYLFHRLLATDTHEPDHIFSAGRYRYKRRALHLLLINVGVNIMEFVEIFFVKILRHTVYIIVNILCICSYVLI